MDKKFLLNYPGRIGSQIPLAYRDHPVCKRHSRTI